MQSLPHSGGWCRQGTGGGGHVCRRTADGGVRIH